MVRPLDGLTVTLPVDALVRTIEERRDAVVPALDQSVEDQRALVAQLQTRADALARWRLLRRITVGDHLGSAERELDRRVERRRIYTARIEAACSMLTSTTDPTVQMDVDAYQAMLRDPL